MNKIIEAAQNIDKIRKFNYEIHCPLCEEKQWALFDKLFTYSYGKCTDCTDAEELKILGENAFAIL